MAAVPQFRIWSYMRSSVLILASTAVGDIGCQGILHKAEKKTNTPPPPFMEFWDKKRTAIMMINSFFIMSPIMYSIQFWLEKSFPGKELKTIGKKMAINYLIAPLVVSLTFCTVNLMKGKSLADVKDKIAQDLPSTLIAGGLYWPVVHFFNFRFMPFDYRPFISSFAGAVWNIYISNQTNKPVEPEQEVNIIST